MFWEFTLNGDPSIVARYLQAQANKGVKSVMVISHLPLEDYLVSELCPQKDLLIFAALK